MPMIVYNFLEIYNFNAFAFNFAVNNEIHFHFGILKPRGRTLKHIWNVGFSAAMQQSISSMMIFGMNQILLGFTTAAPAFYVICTAAEHYTDPNLGAEKYDRFHHFL